MEVLHQFHGTGTDQITPDKYPGIERNVRHFLQKHPYAIAMPEELVYELFKGFLPFKHAHPSIHQGEFIDRKVYDFTDPQLLNTFKESIMMASNQTGLEIIINDYIEDTDLDLWIQLLGPRNSTPKYFPVLSKPYLKSSQFIAT